MSRQPIDRRAFLRGAGGVALGLPFLQAMLPRGASAQAAKPPTRLLTFFTANGINERAWPTSMELAGTTLAPLERFKDRLIVTRGLAMESAMADTGAHDGSHYNGWAHMLVGDLQDGTRSGGNVSFDVEASNLIALDSSLKLPYSYHGGSSAWTAIGQSAGGFDRPLDAWNAIFKDLSVSPGEGPDPAEVMKQMRRRTILDQVGQSMSSLCGDLGREDRVKMQVHLDAVRALERRIGEGFSVGAGCVRPPEPAEDCPSRLRYDACGANGTSMENCFPGSLGYWKGCYGYPKYSIDYRWSMDLHMDLLTMALACDLTRVGGLVWGGPVDGTRLDWVPNLGFIDPGSGGKVASDNHHVLSHDSSSAAQDAIVSINHWYAQQLASLMDRLDAVTEADGSTLLDNTIICWVSECGLTHNGHPRRNLGITLAGGAGGKLNMGQYINFGPGLDVQAGTEAQKMLGGNHLTPGRAHNDLMVELINAVVPDSRRIDTFGGQRLEAAGIMGVDELNSGGLPEIRT